MKPLWTSSSTWMTVRSIFQTLTTEAPMCPQCTCPLARVKKKRDRDHGAEKRDKSWPKPSHSNSANANCTVFSVTCSSSNPTLNNNPTCNNLPNKQLPHQQQRRSLRETSASLSATEPVISDQLLYTLVFVTSLWIYSNSLTGDLVHDDLSAIRDNGDVIGTHSLAQLWKNDFWGSPMSDPTSHKSYRPLTILTFRWNYWLSGLRPWSYHLINVILHAVATCLFAVACRWHLKTSLTTTTSSAFLFALHPIHTEAVSGIVGRADVLAAIFFLLAFLFYVKAFRIDAGVSTSSASLLSSAAAIPAFSGSNGASSAVPILFCGTPPRSPSPALSFSSSASSTSSFCSTSSMPGSDTTTSTAASAWGSETGMTTTPSGTSWSEAWPVVQNRSFFLLSFMMSASALLAKEHGVCVLAMVALWDVVLCGAGLRRAWREGKWHPGLTSLATRLIILGAEVSILLGFRLGLLNGQLPHFSDQDNPAAFCPDWTTRWMTFLFLPAFNFHLLLEPINLSYDWQMGSIPLISSCWDIRNLGSLVFSSALAWLVFKAVRYGKRILIWSLLMLVLPFLPASNLFFPVGFVVAERLLYLPSMGFSLLVGYGLEKWGHRLSKNKAALFNCGFLLLLTAFGLKTWSRSEDWSSRESLFTSGLKTLPGNAKMHYNYANLQKDLGHVELAVKHYQQAIRLWPGHASAHNNLGTLLNDTNMAEKHFRQALKIHPLHVHAHYNLATIKQLRGQIHEAVLLLERCLQLDSKHKDAIALRARISLSNSESSAPDLQINNPKLALDFVKEESATKRSTSLPGELDLHTAFRLQKNQSSWQASVASRSTSKNIEKEDLLPYMLDSQSDANGWDLHGKMGR